MTSTLVIPASCTGDIFPTCLCIFQ